MAGDLRVGLRDRINDMGFRLQRYQIVLVLLIASISYGLATGYPFFYRLSYLIGLLLLGTYIWSWFNLKNVDILFHTRSSRVQLGDSVEIVVEVTNNARFQKSNLEVTIGESMGITGLGRIINIESRTTRAWVTQGTAWRRGIFTIGPIKAVSSDPFGIFYHRRTWVGNELLTVVPKPRPISPKILTHGHLLNEGIFRRRDHHITPYASHVREYHSGDPLSRIHWLTSARTNRLMVKQFDEETGIGLVVLLDVNSAEHFGIDENSTLEYGVTLVASLAQWAVNHRVPVGLISNGENPIVISPESGAEHLLRILESLATVNPNDGKSINEMLVMSQLSAFRRSQVVVVTPALNDLQLNASSWPTRNRVKPDVFLLDAASFGGPPFPEGVMQHLQTLGIMVHPIRKGDFDFPEMSTVIRGQSPVQRGYSQL